MRIGTTPALTGLTLLLTTACLPTLPEYPDGADGAASQGVGSTTAALSLAADLAIDRVDVVLTDQDGDSTAHSFPVDGLPATRNFRLPPGEYRVEGEASLRGRPVARGSVDGVQVLPDRVNPIRLPLTELGDGDRTEEAPLVVEINHVPRVFLVSAPFVVPAGTRFAVEVGGEDPDSGLLRFRASFHGLPRPVELAPDAGGGRWHGALVAPQRPGDYLLDLEVLDGDGGIGATAKPIVVTPGDATVALLERVAAEVHPNGQRELECGPPCGSPEDFGLTGADAEALAAYLEWVNGWIRDGLVELDEEGNPQATGDGLPSPGHATLTKLGADFQFHVDSFFDIWTEVGIDGGGNVAGGVVEVLRLEGLLGAMTEGPSGAGTSGVGEIALALAPAPPLPAAFVRVGLLPAIRVPRRSDAIDLDNDGTPDGYIGRAPGPMPTPGVFLYLDENGNGRRDIPPDTARTWDDGRSWKVTQGVDPGTGEITTWIKVYDGDGRLIDTVTRTR